MGCTIQQPCCSTMITNRLLNLSTTPHWDCPYWTGRLRFLLPASVNYYPILWTDSSNYFRSGHVLSFLHEMFSPTCGMCRHRTLRTQRRTTYCSTLENSGCNREANKPLQSLDHVIIITLKSFVCSNKYKTQWWHKSQRDWRRLHNKCNVSRLPCSLKNSHEQLYHT